MSDNGTEVRGAPALASNADILPELQRLRKSMLRLLRTAERVGLAIPRSCCRHPGDNACLHCSADWVVARVREAAPRKSAAISRPVEPRTAASVDRAGAGLT